MTMWLQFFYLVIFGAFLIGSLVSKLLYDFYLSKKSQKAQDIIKEAKQESQEIIQKTEEKSEKLTSNAQKDIQKRYDRLDELEDKIGQRETKISQREDKVVKREENLQSERKDLIEKQKELDNALQEKKEMLSKISNLSPEKAEQKLMDMLKRQKEKELWQFMDKYETIKKQQADQKAIDLVSSVLPRVAVDDLNDYTLSMVDLPSEDTKGKIIWREWRNIDFIEKVTGTEVIIDDTPLTVKVSSYDVEKRFKTVKLLEKLIKDWRINPVYIQEKYKEVEENMDKIMLKEWKKALRKISVPIMEDEVTRYIGKMQLRSSYGQNLLEHALEVAKIAELIANEFGLDGMIAKKAGILHDIGKLTAKSWEWHAKVWADILKKYNFSDEVINAAESHHFDVDMSSPYSYIIAASDAISASREGVRNSAEDVFIERMRNLESLVKSVKWVSKVHIMQAGREIISFVNPEDVSDLELRETNNEIATKIDEQLDYPGVIRVVVIRENKVIDYIK